jgi:hypothetical protein
MFDKGVWLFSKLALRASPLLGCPLETGTGKPRWNVFYCQILVRVTLFLQ